MEHLAEEDDLVVREVPHPRCETVEEVVLVGAAAAVNSEPEVIAGEPSAVVPDTSGGSLDGGGDEAG